MNKELKNVGFLLFLTLINKQTTTHLLQHFRY